MNEERSYSLRLRLSSLRAEGRSEAALGLFELSAREHHRGVVEALAVLARIEPGLLVIATHAARVAALCASTRNASAVPRSRNRTRSLPSRSATVRATLSTRCAQRVPAAGDPSWRLALRGATNRARLSEPGGA